MAQALVVALKGAGNDLSRENILHAARTLPDSTKLRMVLPEIVISTTPDDYRPMTSLRPRRFDGKM